jgi:alpha-glucuronidase
MAWKTREDGSTLAAEIGNNALIQGVAGIGNVGRDKNWCGSTLSQANFYGFGRLSWNPCLSAEQIAHEWSRLSFSAAENTVSGLLLGSYAAYEKYTSPFGLCFMVVPGGHYGPSPEGYEFDRWGTYHRADTRAIGIERGPAGTNFTGQYPLKISREYADISQCPENLLLFFHRVNYTYVMKNGKTLIQNIYNNHFEGYEDVQAMLKAWEGLKGAVSGEVYESVLERFKRQLENARQWRDVINTWFHRKTGIDDEQGRRIFP